VKDSNSALTHLAQAICIGIVASCLAFVPQARAITFAGTSSGTFVDPTGGPDLVTTGVNTDTFTWGTGVGTPPSLLNYTGKVFAGIVPEQSFSIGTLKYFNGTLMAGTEAESVALRTLLEFTAPSGLAQSFDFDFKLINTPNIGNDEDNADKVSLSSLFPTTIFTVDGVDYTLKLEFGSVVSGGFSKVNEFSVFEGSTAYADLVGTITASAPPSVPDSGSTLAMMAMAIVGVGGLRQYLTRTA
jgi:hypothetical protein